MRRPNTQREGRLLRRLLGPGDQVVEPLRLVGVRKYAQCRRTPADEQGVHFNHSHLTFYWRGRIEGTAIGGVLVTCLLRSDLEGPLRRTHNLDLALLAY